MIEYANRVNDQYRTRTVSKNREGAHISPEEVKQIFEIQKDKLKKSPTLTNYVNYLIVALMSGVFEEIVPKRLEWASVKIKNYDTEKDNYMDKKFVVHFNQYKTAKYHGTQTVQIIKEIQPTLKKWLKMNDTEYLLLNNNGKPFSPSTLSQRIGVIFGNDKIGVDVLRSIFLTEVYKNVDVERLDRIAREMGHSRKTAEVVYNKKK